MNKERRSELAYAASHIEDVISELEIIRSDEDDAYNNLNEGLQFSERGQAMQDAIDMIDDFIDQLQAVANQVYDMANGKKRK